MILLYMALRHFHFSSPSARNTRPHLRGSYFRTTFALSLSLSFPDPRRNTHAQGWVRRGRGARLARCMIGGGAGTRNSRKNSNKSTKPSEQQAGASRHFQPAAARKSGRQVILVRQHRAPRLYTGTGLGNFSIHSNKHHTGQQTLLLTDSFGARGEGVRGFTWLLLLRPGNHHG